MELEEMMLDSPKVQSVPKQDLTPVATTVTPVNPAIQDPVSIVQEEDPEENKEAVEAVKVSQEKLQAEKEKAKQEEREAEIA